MSTAKNVFIVGPGFIGWSVLDLLVAEGYKVTGLVRRQEHADGIEASGATAVLGDLNDKALIAEKAAAHDIVIHTATSDHLPSVEAVLDGVKTRASKGQMTIFIHTSGTAVLDDGAKGEFLGEDIYDDKAPAKINSVPDSAEHREIDLTILKAQEELGEKAKMAIMLPPLIYGFNPANRRLSIQIPTLTRFALKHGYAAHVGKGESVESNIHVMDLARGFVVVLHHMEKASPAPLLENPYFFCEKGEASWKEVSSAIAEGLYKAGKLDEPTTKTLPEDLYGDVLSQFTAPVIGLNSRSRALRLRDLGWEPKEKDWKSSYLEDELPEILKEDNSSFTGYKVR